MSTATLDQIETALWTALAALVADYSVVGGTAAESMIVAGAGATASPTQPLRALHRYAGEVSRYTGEGHERGLGIMQLQQLPAALLAFEDERPAEVITQHGAVQIVGRSSWRVYCVVGDLRGDAHATVSAVAGQTAVLALAHAVKRALAGLAIEGLFDARPVAWEQTLPWVIARRTSYIYAVRFSADAALPESSEEDLAPPGVPLGGVRGSVDDAQNDNTTPPAPVSLSTFDETF